ncbi:MAG: sulfite exporter TauE/SafE family protein [Pseudohongiellaceae bacterium]
MEFLIHILAGAAVGFAIGVTGVGGGSLMTPLLLMFNYPVPVAIGTDLLYAAITKSGGAWSHHRRHNVNWRVVFLLAAGSLPVSILVHLLVLQRLLAENHDYSGVLTFSLGIMLIVTSLILIFREPLRRRAQSDQPSPVMDFIHRHQTPATVIMGMLLGVCVTLSSVGAGAFGAAVLLVIYSQSATVRIVGTDIAHAVPLTLIAGLGYLFAGFVDYTLLISLLIGSLPAIHLGSRLSNAVPEKVLQRILIVLLLGLGVRYAIL